MKCKIKDYMNLEPKTVETYYEIINKDDVDKDIKLFCILELIHSEKLGIKAAYELCTKYKIFNEEWTTIDAKTTEIFEKLYNK